MADRLLVLALAVSLASAARPAALDLASQTAASNVISRMVSTTDETMDPDRIRILREAQAYNMQLGGDGAHPNNVEMGGSNESSEDILLLGDDDLATEPIAYEEQLRWREVDALCWIEIPACNIIEPVYRGTADETLAQGVGHLASSSLPVGGISSNCVLAAHSGMDRSHMFDDLETLAEGDTIIIHTLGDAYWYEVYDREVVRPEAAAAHCAIVAGEDLCTLLTCTPYGINSHRLLIHGRRTPVCPEMPRSHPNATTFVTRHTLPLAMVGAGLAPLAAAGALSKLCWRRRVSLGHRRGVRPLAGQEKARRPWTQFPSARREPGGRT